MALMEAVRPEVETTPQRAVLMVGHTYQPPREFLRLANTHARADIVSQVNERIYRQCYQPVFETPVLPDTKNLPDGFIFSVYGTLREWWKGHHPQGFDLAVQRINKLPDKEYRVLGDSYLHPILPLQSAENQDMLIKIGKQAFICDFGFEPKGFWLPETAISQTTLTLLFKNGYEFVVLRDDQLQSAEQNPMYIAIHENEKYLGEIAVIHCDSDLSGSVSFPANEDITANARDFLRNPRHAWKRNLTWMTDTEFYGHHEQFKDHFLYTVTKPDVLASANLVAFDVRKALQKTLHIYTQVWENSSWSCPHNLDRWTGDPNCLCDQPDQDTLSRRQYLRQTLTALGQEIEKRLDAIDPFWREEFVKFFLATRRSMYFAGDIEKDINNLIESGQVPILARPEIRILFKANLARWTAETSCVWFFTGQRVERQIAQIGIQDIEQLLNDLEQVKTNSYAA